MAADTLARMFWDRVERSAGRPAQSFKQGAGWKTVTWREVGEIQADMEEQMAGRPGRLPRWDDLAL